MINFCNHTWQTDCLENFRNFEQNNCLEFHFLRTLQQILETCNPSKPT